MTERWYSVDEISSYLGIARETVYRWIEGRDLPAHRLGKFWKFKLAEVDAWVRSGQGLRSSGMAGSPDRDDRAINVGGTTLTDADMDRDPVLQEIISRIVEALKPVRIYLFGSRARGDAGDESDYDIVVLIEHPTEPRYRLSREGYRALQDVPAAVDVVVWDRATFDARLHLEASFPATVVREGRAVYDA